MAKGPKGCASCRSGNHHTCNGFDGDITRNYPDSLPRCGCPDFDRHLNYHPRPPREGNPHE